MQKHLDTLGYAYMGYAGWVLFSATFATTIMVVAGIALAHDPEAWALLAFAPAVMALGITMAVPFIVVGRGLHARRPWARWVALALVCVTIGSLPFGFALSVAALVILTDNEVTEAFTLTPTRA